ncbi:hypothetical protein BJX76DRAFT_366068 [Aspergillus varians]
MMANGSRHISDLAPFSLWDNDRQTFRLPSDKERQWIYENFQVETLTFEWPKIIIETSHPPKPIPLTVGCVAASFVPVGDPIPKNRHLEPWCKPSQQQLESIFSALDQFATIIAINFVPPDIVVELAVDEKSYGRRTLPGVVVGRTTLYYHDRSPFWNNSLLSRERLIQPTDTIQDETDYIAASRTMCPGAVPPRKLIWSDNVEIKQGRWCSVDGMASGLMFLRIHAMRYLPAQRLPGVVLPMTTFHAEYVFEYVGPEGDQIRDGVCGAPIVIDGDTEDGGGDVVGFFQLGAQGSPWAIAPCLDDLVDRGWAIV